jgi:hypothetical protein
MTALRNSLGIVCAAAFMLCCATVWVAIVAPRSSFAQTVAKVAPMADIHAVAAEMALESGDFARAKGESRAELSVSPVREDGWVRLAKVDLALHHGLTMEGQDDLAHSYDAEPFDLQASSLRMTVMLDHFAALSATLRMSLDDELNAWASSPGLHRRLSSLLADPHTPPGAKLAIQVALAPV